MLGIRPEGLPKSVFMHPLAFVESANIGEGTRLWAFSHVMKDSHVGSNCNVCEGVFIESGAWVGNKVTIKNGISIWTHVIVEDEVFLGPHMIFTNDLRPRTFRKKTAAEFLQTKVERGATIGAGACIAPGITIGSYSFIGIGAVVTNDIPKYGLAYGNPAKLVGYICQCADTKFSLDSKISVCEKCGTRIPQLENK